VIAPTGDEPRLIDVAVWVQEDVSKQLDTPPEFFFVDIEPPFTDARGNRWERTVRGQLRYHYNFKDFPEPWASNEEDARAPVRPSGPVTPVLSPIAALRAFYGPLWPRWP